MRALKTPSAMPFVVVGALLLGFALAAAAAIEANGSDLRRATIDDVQTALETMRVKEDGTPASAATVNTQIAAVKALLGFAHQVGYTTFNVGPLIKLKKAPRTLAQRIIPEVEVQLLIRAAKAGRDRAMFEVAYYGGLRVSELAALTWSQVIPSETGEAQLAVIGKGDKDRHVLIPADVAERLKDLRGEVPADASVFGIKELEINYLIKRTAKRAGVNQAASAHWFRHAHASHALDTAPRSRSFPRHSATPISRRPQSTRTPGRTRVLAASLSVRRD